MAIFRGDPNKAYALFVEPADRERHPEEVVIKREYRDYYGGLVKQHCRVHRSMIPGLIEDLKRAMVGG
jgi:hypothetical protein